MYVCICIGREKEAEKAYLKAIHFKPDHINGNINMGHLCRMQARWTKARRHYNVALKKRPQLATLHYYVGLVSEELGTAEDLEVYTCMYNYNNIHVYMYIRIYVGCVLTWHSTWNPS